MRLITRILTTSAAAVAGVVLVAACASSSHRAATSTDAAGAPAAAYTPPAPATTGPAKVSPASTPSRGIEAQQTRVKPLTAAQLRARATAAVAKLSAGQPAGAVSVAEVNLTTGATYSAGATSGMWTASAYKLFVLETLLLQEQGGGLDSGQQAEATTMIENSDNAAGYSLFLAAGGNPGLASAAATFGMTDTVPGATDPTFTETSATDYLHLLRNLVVPGPLNAQSQAYALGLMRNVEADQRWGVGVVADPGTDFANKNGWLSVDDTNGPGEDDNGLWVVTSTGVLTVRGQTVLMAVFTQHQPSMADGVTLVQSLARAIIPVVEKAA